jgi:hypothetical protein
VLGTTWYDSVFKMPTLSEERVEQTLFGHDWKKIGNRLYTPRQVGPLMAEGMGI